MSLAVFSENLYEIRCGVIVDIWDFKIQGRDVDKNVA